MIITSSTRGPAHAPRRLAHGQRRGTTCARGNVASTAAIVFGERAQDWLTQRDVDARLVHRDGHVATTGRWPTAVAVP